MKLHKQYGHPKSSRLIDLIKTGITDSTFLESVKELNQSCEICLCYKKPNLRPIVGF